jgi:hypothetical protein
MCPRWSAARALLVLLGGGVLLLLGAVEVASLEEVPDHTIMTPSRPAI